jgi:hypothetical protein
MKYKIVQSKFVAFGLFGVAGIVLYPFVFVIDKNNKRLVNHELIHIEQIKDCGVLKFYVLYLWYWIKHKFSYRNIPFEVEAYDNDEDFEYIKTRGRKTWLF